jgi:hypothetical protein
MRTSIKAIAPALILAAGLLLSVKTSPAKPDYTRRTSKDCEFCHPPNSRKLNQAGEYYRDHGNSLKGYVPPEPSKEQTKARPQEKPTPSTAKSK